MKRFGALFFIILNILQQAYCWGVFYHVYFRTGESKKWRAMPPSLKSGGATAPPPPTPRSTAYVWSQSPNMWCKSHSEAKWVSVKHILHSIIIKFFWKIQLTIYFGSSDVSHPVRMFSQTVLAADPGLDTVTSSFFFDDALWISWS